MSSLYIGIDIGTSGCRAITIDEKKNIIAQASISLPASCLKNGHLTQQPDNWWFACQLVMNNLLAQVNRNAVKAIAIDATSGSVLLCENNGAVVSDAYMYNDKNNLAEAEQIKQFAPTDCGAHGASSGLAKCLSLVKRHHLKVDKPVKCLNQADWVAGMFMQKFNCSDHNNSLKLGYDMLNQQWPEWLSELNCRQYLVDNIYPPGTSYGSIDPDLANSFGLKKTTQIVAGTTDSIAAFIATGCNAPGQAVTSLGSTLAIKLIAKTPIYAPKYGIYSHRLGNFWLVGGASNTGGAVLSKYFDTDQINKLTAQLRADIPTDLDYYPLLESGERFPINDNKLAPRLSPRPKSDLKFFQAMLEGIANIEKAAYEKLTALGVPYPTHVYTMGGGSHNETWQKMRQKILGIPVSKANITEAAFGSALLAKQSAITPGCELNSTLNN